MDGRAAGTKRRNDSHAGGRVLARASTSALVSVTTVTRLKKQALF